MSSSDNGTNSRRSVELLREDVASKIAAGEVIEKPASVLRELLDNSIDSGATAIDVSVEDGGLALVQVEDNGSGMTRDDISLCWLSHATSKIRHEDDLSRITSLGFRGEALASIAAVSRLEIVSRASQEESGNLLVVHAGKQISLHPHAWQPGTRVRVQDLFYNLPARRKFLSSARAETGICKRIALEKAQAFPEIAFNLSFGQQTIKLPAHKIAGDNAYLRRFLDISAEAYRPEFFTSISGTGDGYTYTLLLGNPAIFRKDRKQIQIYVNRRRIYEYALQQAIEYGYQGFLPGGSYPVAFAFIDVDPSLVDFNIHPAKREARFRNLQFIHRSLSSSVQEFLIRETGFRTRTGGSYPFLPPVQGAQAPGTAQSAFDLRVEPYKAADSLSAQQRTENYAAFHSDSRPYTSAAADRQMAPPNAQLPAASGAGVAGQFAAAQPRRFRYLGQLFSLFLVTELGERLLLIDMHAAHERLLFDELRANPRSQELLIPMEIEEGIAGRQDAERIATQLSRLGFQASAEGAKLVVSSAPGIMSTNESILRDFVRDQRGDFADIERKLYATLACRSAVKDGDSISVSMAEDLIARVLELENPRCPHGRPIWFELSRAELFERVGRTGLQDFESGRRGVCFQF